MLVYQVTKFHENITWLIFFPNSNFLSVHCQGFKKINDAIFTLLVFHIDLLFRVLTVIAATHLSICSIYYNFF